jgi:hypothetical protein
MGSYGNEISLWHARTCAVMSTFHCGHESDILYKFPVMFCVLPSVTFLRFVKRLSSGFETIVRLCYLGMALG